MKSFVVNKRSFLKFDRRSPRVLFASVAVATVVLCATLFPFASASCRTTTTQDAPASALERLRALAHAAPPAASDALTRFEREAQQIETANRGTSAAALARVLRARTRAEQARDYAGAARTLDDATLLTQTAIGDYILSLRASYLEKANRKQEARAVYEQLARDYPASLRRSHAATRAAELVIEETPDKQAGARAALLFLRQSIERDDTSALLLAATAAETSGDLGTASRHLRRIIFYQPAAPEAVAARSALTRLGASTDPATIDEARTRAEQLYAARRYAEAADAYAELARRFPAAVNPQTNLRRGIALASIRRVPEASAALRQVPLSAGETHAEALATIAIAQARAKSFTDAQTTLDELRRLHPRSTHTRDALVRAGEAARDAKNSFYAQNFFNAAVVNFRGAAEVAGAQFEIAWAAHEAGRFDESAQLLIEHLASYADRNTDNRGRAGYWAARDSERANRLGDAAALYEAMQARYDANWYGYLAKQQLERRRVGIAQSANNPFLGRAIANLATITVGSSTLTADDESALARAEQLGAIGLDDFAFAEFDQLAAKHPTDPRANLARAQLHQARSATIANERVPALNALRRSYPDYSQMKPEELSRAEWEIFYPLTNWDVIRREAEAKRLDPYTVAGLIRQESVFDPRAASHANAYGLMQLLVPTAQSVARRYNVGRGVSRTALFDPELNITLGTGYMRDQFDEFGKLEYVAAAYNAGPGRPRRWRNELPAAIDEWTEAIPFRETRGYVQGVVRNMLQYRRLYDEQGRFRTEVGTRPARSQAVVAPRASPDSNDNTRPRRVAEPKSENER